MAHPFRLTLAFVAVAAVILSGCGSSGGSSSSSSSATVSLSKAGLIAQADPICKEVTIKREVANKALAAAKDSLSAVAKAAPEIAADEQQAIVRLRALQAPTALAGDWRTMLAGMQRLATETRELGTLAKSGNTAEAKKVTEGGRQIRKSLATIAARDGFQYCGLTS